MTSWARLVDQSGNSQPLVEDEVIIGRAKDCTISLTANRLVSARHCKIYKDKDGKVWLADNRHIHNLALIFILRIKVVYYLNYVYLNYHYLAQMAHL
jgi:hypothetical protein